MLVLKSSEISRYFLKTSREADVACKSLGNLDLDSVMKNPAHCITDKPCKENFANCESFYEFYYYLLYVCFYLKILFRKLNVKTILRQNLCINLGFKNTKVFNNVFKY